MGRKHIPLVVTSFNYKLSFYIFDTYLAGNRQLSIWQQFQVISDAKEYGFTSNICNPVFNDNQNWKSYKYEILTTSLP